MFELMFCSLITILPDYLIRRSIYGTEWASNLSFFTVWYELRWGITLCAMFTTMLITVVFYYHPSTSHVMSLFRTVTILSEQAGRVEEVFVENNQIVEAGDPVFLLDSSAQEAARETALRQIEEIDASLQLAQSDRAAAEAAIGQAQAALEQTQDDLERQSALLARGSAAVSQRDVDVLESELGVRQGELEAAEAGLEAVDTNIAVVLPARRASAEAALEQAEVEIEKLTIYAGVSGVVEQFSLQRGDIVNPVLRPAGILVPVDSGRGRFQAGFSQVSTQVVREGGVAELMCMSKPFKVIPMVIVEVQDVIAAGQVRPTDQLVDVQPQGRPPGAMVAFLEPVYPGQTDDIPPGSRCMANAYTDNHQRLEDPSLGTLQRIALHVVDTVGVVHAAGLRIRSLLLPFNTLVFSGH
ncbi:MAG: biotin/lipoyl-binding protein [Pseudomonadota bacterium]